MAFCGGAAVCRRRPAAGPPGCCRALRDETFAARTESFGVRTQRQCPVKVFTAVSFSHRPMRSRWTVEMRSEASEIWCDAHRVPFTLPAVGSQDEWMRLNGQRARSRATRFMHAVSAAPSSARHVALSAPPPVRARHVSAMGPLFPPFPWVSYFEPFYAFF